MNKIKAVCSYKNGVAKLTGGKALFRHLKYSKAQDIL